MKTKLALMASSIVAVLSPVAPMIYVALISILLDTCFGVWRSVKKNGWVSFKSRRLSSTLRSVPILSDDTPAELAARVLTQEHQLYPAVLKRFAVGDKTPIMRKT